MTGDKQIPLRCAFADFGVREGLMTSQALAVDTTDTLIVGEGETWGWSSPAVLGLAAAAVLSLAAWAVWQLRAPAPLVDLRLARGRSAAIAHATALLAGFANYLLLASAPRLAQTPESTGYGFGTSIVVAGLVLLPFSLASMVAGRLARRLDRWAGPRAVLSVGALGLGVGLLLFGLVRGELCRQFY